MLQITPQMKILVAVEPADFRRGIDGLARLCKDALGQDPFAGTVFVFRNRRGTAIKVLVYDGAGLWLCNRRLQQGRFSWPHGDTAGAPLTITPAQWDWLIAGAPWQHLSSPSHITVV